MAEIVNSKGGQEIVFQIKRKGELIDVPLTPQLKVDTPMLLGWEKYVHDPETLTALLNARRQAIQWRIGIVFRMPPAPRTHVGVGTAAKEAIVYPVRQTKMILVGLYEWITGKQEGRVSSVVGITSEVKKAIEEGWITAVLLLMVLNVYLGLFNLFPLPALDGGRLVFLGYEMVTRRRANPKLEATIHMVGVLVLAVLLVVVTVNDCRNL
jgi:RIP metalloprotease RseP